jgi:hypothetical protein
VGLRQTHGHHLPVITLAALDYAHTIGLPSQSWRGKRAKPKIEVTSRRRYLAAHTSQIRKTQPMSVVAATLP